MKKLLFLIFLALSLNISAQNSHVVSTSGNSFAPNLLNISVGDTVTWVNTGGWHNVNATLASYPNNPEGFGNAVAGAGWSFQWIFTIAGTYNYQCDPHVGYYMFGSVNVSAIPIFGCTDVLATNYDPTATVDDGSCIYVCAEDAPSNIYCSNVIHDRATINWDNMNSTACMVDQYRIKYREVGTSNWSSKTMGAPVGSCNFGTQKVDKLILNLNSSTIYEYQMRAWYCGGGNSAWTALQYFTTEGVCLNIINLQVITPTTSKATFTWDSTAAYSFVRIKARIDVAGSTWFNVGGFGVNYPTLTKDKNGLIPGTSYRAQARTWCNPSGGAYRSATWTPIVLWTQPAVIRLANPELTERTLLRITDLLGREVNPNKVIDKTTLLYLYDDGTVEKRINLDY